MNNLRAGSRLEAFNTATLGVQVANHIAHEFFRSNDLNVHHWFKHQRLAAFDGFL